MLNFAANKDDDYLALLRVARISENLRYSSSQLSSIVNTLNSLHKYKIAHKRIIPLLRLKAKKLNIYHQLNTDIQQLLNNETHKGVITELAQKSQLMNIINLMSAQNITIILLKGSAFAHSLYNSNAPRTSNDIDILVKQEDWQRAQKIISTTMNPLPIRHKQVFDNLYETSFVPKGNVGATVDLHQSLVHPHLFSINENDLWNESVKHPEYNSDLVRVLCSEHALIHQALHAFKDMDFSKYNMVDTHEIVKQGNPNLAKTFSIAKQWCSTIPLYVLLNNCSNIMETLTVAELNLLQPSKPNRLTQFMCEKLLKSKSNKFKNNIKTIKYRIIQLMAQFVFTGSFIRPISLQWMFIKTMMKNKK